MNPGDCADRDSVAATKDAGLDPVKHKKQQVTFVEEVSSSSSSNNNNGEDRDKDKDKDKGKDKDKDKDKKQDPQQPASDPTHWLSQSSPSPRSPPLSYSALSPPCVCRTDTFCTSSTLDPSHRPSQDTSPTSSSGGPFALWSLPAALLRSNT